MKTFGSITLVRSTWHVNADAHVIIRLKRLFARAKAETKSSIQLKDSEEVCKDLLWVLERYPMSITDKDRAHMESRTKEYDVRSEQVHEILTGTLKPREFELAIPAREYQKVAADMALRMKGLLIGDQIGVGKEQPVDTNILTPKGWRKLGDIQTGDQVIGSNGKPINVLGVFPQGVKPSYRVSFWDGSSVETGAEHLWTVNYLRGGKVKDSINVTTEQLRTKAKIVRRWPKHKDTVLNLGKTPIHIPVLSGPVVFEPSAALPIHPYLLGQLIANGSLGQSGTTLTVGTKDFDELKTYLDDTGIYMSNCRHYGTTTHISIPGITPQLRELNLKVLSSDKHIPRSYLQSSVENRVHLFHGLMNGDGSISSTRNRISYHTTSEQLAKDVVELIECLGGTAQYHTYDRSHDNKPTEYPVRLHVPGWLKPFTLKRKLDRYSISVKTRPFRGFNSIEYVRDVECVCIKVDAKDQLYATEHAILTHNTITGICTLLPPESRPALVVTLTHLTGQWQRELAKFAPQLTTHILKKGTPYPMEMPDVIITNYHKLSGWRNELAGKINAVIYDEIQELRRPESQKYQAARMISREATYNVGLSATPIFNLGIEFYHIIDILRPDVLGTTSEYTREWCSGDVDMNGRAALRDPKAFGMFLRDNGIMIRRTRKDIGRELPPVSKIIEYVDSDEKAFTEMEGGVADLAKFILAKSGTRTERMQASGELDWKLRQSTGVAKALYVAEFVKLLVDSGEKVILFAWHHLVYDIYMEKLAEYKPVMYTGKESVPQKEAARKAFIEGDSKILIMSLRAGAGLDGLQKICSVVVIGELDWSPGVIEQCIGRVDRDGQDTPVMAYFAISNEGSDPVIMDSLGVKRGQIEGVRDPNGELILDVPMNENKIQQLAEAVLRKRGIAIPSDSMLDLPT